MHQDSYDEMQRVLAKYLDSKLGYKVADIGSQLIVGLGLQKTYKDLMHPNWDYVGIDIVKGENVDILMTPDNAIPLPDECKDVIISGQCLEHCKNPFILIKEMARITKCGGLIIMVSPFGQGMHCNPDRWRFLPQGFEALFDSCEIESLETYLHGGKKWHDCWGVGKKP